MPRLAPALLAPSWFACGSPTKWEDCDDARCRAVVAEQTFEARPQRVLADLPKLDPLEQAALVDLLLHARPDAIGQVCGAVPSGSPAEARCQQLNLRPHLFTAPPQSTWSASSKRPGGGPNGMVPPPIEAQAPWRGKQARPGDLLGTCGKGEVGCLKDHAMALAASGDLVSAGLVCDELWPDGTQVHNECLFTIAEEAVGRSARERVLDALATCASAGALAANCTQHVLEAVVPTAPPADRPDAQSVAEIEALVAFFRSSLPEPWASSYGQFALASWTLHSFQQARRVTGHLLTALPEEAAPHVRMAAAYRWFELGGQASSLDQVAGQLKAALEVTGPMVGSASRTASTAATGEPPRAYWSYDASELEARVPAIWCLAAGRRTLAADPDDDLRISVLEAAARADPRPGPTFFGDVVGSEQIEAVRWTAARLLTSNYKVESPAYFGRDPSALVEDALRGP